MVKINNIGNPHDFLYKDVVPEILNHIREQTIKKPGSTFGPDPKHPISTSRKMKYSYIKRVKKTACF